MSGRALERRLLRETSGGRGHLRWVVVLGLAETLAILAQAGLLAQVIDRAAMHGAGLHALTPALAALAAVLAARAVLSGSFELTARLGARRTMSELRGALVRRLLSGAGAPREPGRRDGDVVAAAVQGVDALQDYYAGYLPQLVLATLVPLAVIAYTAVIDPVASGLLAITVPILIVFMILVGKAAAAQTEQRWRTLQLLSSHFLDVLAGLQTLRAHRRERAQEETLAAVGERYRQETVATLRTAFLSAFVLELYAMLGTAIAAAAIGVQLAGGHLALTAGLAVLLLAPELYAPLRAVGAQYHAAAAGTAAAERIYALIDSPSALDSGTVAAGAVAGVVPDPGRSAVRLEGVAYRYPAREGDALDGLDLELAPGEVTALVGPSGAGKSTVARLLMRFADPTDGRLSCGGVDLRDVDAEQWRAQIAWVPQRPRLFAGTIAENIRLGDPQASDERVLAAARDAGAIGFIEALPDGLRTRVGDGAQRLSAGQRRRVALARALLRDARLLILDEPAADLDEESAAWIAQTLARRVPGRTTLLIVHHPVLAEHADHVVRIEHGRRAQSPTHADCSFAREIAA